MAKTTKTKKQRRPIGWVGQVRKPDGTILPGYYWKARHPGTGKRLQKHGGDTAEAAQAALTKFLGEHKPNPETGLVTRTVSQLVTEFLDVADAEVSEYHRKTLGEQLDRFKSSVGDVALERVTRATIQSYMKALGKQDGQRRKVEIPGKFDSEGKPETKVVTAPMSANTQRRHLSAIGAMFALALDRQYVEANPARGITLRRVQQHEPAVLTAEQLGRLYGKLPEQIRALTIFLGETGARRSEGMDLQWPQVADDFSAVTFTATKNRKNRRVRLTARASEILKALHKSHVAPMEGPDVVFPYVSTSEAARLFKAAAKAAALPVGPKPIPTTTMHSLRHTFAVQLTMGGVPFSVTCELLGHHSPAFTAARYARWVPDGAADRAVAALEAARGGAPVQAAQSA